MLAYHGDSAAKAAILKQLRDHAKADELIHGTGWDGGKGCAVGCTVHAYDHSLYEPRFGIPEMLARLEDTIFEGLSNGGARKWPVQFMSAIKPGADLSLVGWQFLHWLLTDKGVNPGIDHPLVRDAVKQCADIIAPLAKGQKPDEGAARSAEGAAWSAAGAAGRAAGAAGSAAWSAAGRAAYSKMAEKLLQLLKAAK